MELNNFVQFSFEQVFKVLEEIVDKFGGSVNNLDDMFVFYVKGVEYFKQC